MGGIIWPDQKTKPENKTPANVESYMQQLEGTGITEGREDYIDDSKDSKKSYEKKLRKLRGKQVSLVDRKKLEKKFIEWQSSLRKIRAIDKQRQIASDARRALAFNRSGTKFEVLQDAHIFKMAGALIDLYKRSAENQAIQQYQSPQGLLDLTLEYFFPSNALVKSPFFSRRIPPTHRIVSGHGFYHPGVKPFRVPAGKYIYFYTHLGSEVLLQTGMALEKVEEETAFAMPYEIFGPGQMVQNHFLAYPGGKFLALTVNVQGRKGGIDEIIVNKNPWRLISLREILADPRCQQATYIHWSACRGEMTSEKCAELGLEFDPPGSRYTSKPRLVVQKDKRPKKIDLARIHTSDKTASKPIYPNFGA